jgi:hypothetical protein
MVGGFLDEGAQDVDVLVGVGHFWGLRFKILWI